MSKIATLKSLPTPADVRQNVAELGRMLADTSDRLDATARQVQSLEQLPSLVAEQVTEAMQALDPILSMRRDVQTALEAFDQVAKAQRQTLEALGQELATSAAQSMETRAASMDGTLQELASQVHSLQSSMSAMESSSKRLQALPASLDKSARTAAELLELSARELARQAERVRPSPWLVLGQMLGVAVLGALLVVGGQAGLNRILPPGEVQQQADWAGAVWSKATEQERKLLNQIVSRPAR